ncbi:MAG TPA: RNA 2',3'-cyclic phosphodiesterase [Solirubrobacteraceae bacterium]|nr:RNA 2',3'-cyclic phosphodiesterase [Solirubrobacteraceae bacterium]
MRLFVALDLPMVVRAELSAWAQQAARPEVRRVPAENLHVTLAFLGARGSDEAAAVRALLPALARPLPGLCTAGALWLPPRRPGVLTVALEADETLTALQAELVAGLTSAIGFEPERRRFRAHVTVGRVARGTRIDTRVAIDPPAPTLRFQARMLTLYRSRTTPQGAHYERLSGVELR